MSRRARRVRSTVGMRIRAAAPPVLAVVLILAAVLLPHPTDGARKPQTVPVSRSAYACPAGVQVSAGQVSPATSVRTTEVPGGGSVADLSGGDRWRQVRTKRAVVVEQVGRGSGAVGFFATTADDSDGAGLMVGSCPATLDESWYVGLGSGAKHESRLELTNLSDVVAVADISLWGLDGPVEAVGGDGLIVKPGQTRTVKLASLASGESELAVRVERRRGAFSVVAFDGSRRVFSGSEVAAPTAAPSRQVILSGLHADARNRSLLLANTSSTTSRVSVSVLGPKGEFAPRGFEAVRLAAGRVTVLDLPAGVGRDAVAVHLTSEEPIVASARVSESKQDYAYAVAAREIDSPAIVPVDLGAGTGRPRITVTAPGAAAAVTVTGYDARMRKLAATRFEVAGGSTSTISLNKLTDSDDLAYVVVEPTGRVLAAAAFRKDDGLASVPLEVAPLRVLGPDVRYVG